MQNPETKNVEVDRANPISFSSADVRQILNGKKTQTRRLVQYQITKYDHSVICRYGNVGDKLWVREPFYLTVKDSDTWFKDFPSIKNKSDLFEVSYLATDNILMTMIDGVFTSAHIDPQYMPRLASRILLEITDIYSEKLHQIRVNDVIKEGYPCAIRRDYEKLFSWYKDKWEFHHGKGHWENNPHVWVIEFKIIEGGKKLEER